MTGNQLKAELIRRGCSQSAFAAFVGRGHATVERWIALRDQDVPSWVPKLLWQLPRRPPTRAGRAA